MFDLLFDFSLQVAQRLPADPQQRLLVFFIVAIIVLVVPLALLRGRSTNRWVAGAATTGKLGLSPAERTIDAAPDVMETPSLTFVPGALTRASDVQTPKRLVVFIHGILGSEESTWGEFPQFLLADPVIASEYDVARFGYRTSLLELTRPPKLEDVARFLDIELETEHGHYAEIVLFAHSMGGLVARRYLADALGRAAKPNGKPCRISRVLFFATPHRGSALPTFAELGRQAVGQLASLFGSALQTVVDAALAKGLSDQLKALAAGSDFLFQLERDEEAVQVRGRIELCYVTAESDLAVDRNSAVGSSSFHIIQDTDHWSVVKPISPESRTVKIAQAFLTETANQTPYAAAAEHRQPVLNRWRREEQAGGIDEHKRFVFKNQAIPFVGREDDLDHIDAFLAPHQSAFRWMVLAGPGGIGKSRLALEVCQAKSAHWWNAGFADPAWETIDWRVWQPRLPTLMCIDYAGRLAEPVGRMLAGLAERSGPHVLRFPVRVLIMERDPNGPWQQQLLDAASVAGSSKVNDSVTRHATRTLARLRDPWPIFQAVDGGGRLGREDTLTALTDIDEQQRPLFAHLMADAISREQDVRAWDKKALLENVLQRDRRFYWRGPSALGDSSIAEATKPEINALALATMIEGMSSVLFNGSHGDLLPTWNLYRHPDLFGAMTGRRIEAGIAPLEPDIVGEFFVLQTLRELHASRHMLIDLAWRTRPERMWWFVSRVGQDFLSDIAETDLLKIDEAGLSALPFWGMAAVNLTNAYGNAGDLTAARSLYDEIKALAQEHDQPEIRIEQAKAAFNLTIDYGNAGDLTAARSLYDEIKALAQEHDQPEIRERQANAAVNLTIDYGNAGDLTAARSLYDEIKALAQEHDQRGDAGLAQVWACAAGVMLAFSESDEAILGSIPAERGDIVSAAKIFRARAEGEPEAAHQLLDEVSGGDDAKRMWLDFLSTPGAPPPGD